MDKILRFERRLTHLVIIVTVAVSAGSDDLGRGRTQVTRTHYAGLSNPETKNQIVSPERYIAVR